MQEEHQLLGTSHGKSGDNDASAAAGGPGDDVRQLVDHVANLLVEAAAVGTLHDQEVGRRHAFGVANDGEVGASDVAGIDEAQGSAAARGVLNGEAGGTENVPGVVGFVAQRVREVEGLVISDAAKEGQGAFGIGHGVEGHNGPLAVLFARVPV